MEPGESDPEALRRELDEELGVRVDVAPPAIARVQTAIRDRVIDLWLYEVRGGDEPQPLEHEALAWVDVDAGDALSWSEADARLWPAVRDRLAR